MERPSIRIRFVRLAKAGREIKNCFAGISLQPATPDECSLIKSDMYDRMTGTISSWKMNTGPQQFFHSTFFTHLAILLTGSGVDTILVGLGHDSERGAIGRRVRPKPRSSEFHGAARLAGLPDSYGSAAREHGDCCRGKGPAGYRARTEVVPQKRKSALLGSPIGQRLDPLRRGAAWSPRSSGVLPPVYWARPCIRPLRRQRLSFSFFLRMTSAPPRCRLSISGIDVDGVSSSA